MRDSNRPSSRPGLLQPPMRCGPQPAGTLVTITSSPRELVCVLISWYQDQTQILPRFSKISTLQRESDLKGGIRRIYTAFGLLGKCTVEGVIDFRKVVARIKGWGKRGGLERKGSWYADPRPGTVRLRKWLRARAAQGERVGRPGEGSQGRAPRNWRCPSNSYPWNL